MESNGEMIYDYDRKIGTHAGPRCVFFYYRYSRKAVLRDGKENDGEAAAVLR